MRKLAAATLALTVAGGVYLATGTAEASNMGFKLERSFSVERFNTADRATSLGNIYFLSFPLFNGLGDVGQSNGTVTNGNRCVGDPGSTAAPDSIIDSTDAICDMWTSRQGQFAVNHFNRTTCQYETQVGKLIVGTTFSFTPAVTLERDAGLQINVSYAGAPPLPQNRAVVVGSHDPSYTGRTVVYPNPICAPAQDIFNLPYHTMYQGAYEILCGLEGVDWVDANSDTFPDTCPSMTAGPPATTGGIFDNGNGPSHAISVTTFDNDPTSTTANQFVVAVVKKNLAGSLQFPGPNFPLKPGDAYQVNISPGHTGTMFLSPHF